MRKLHTHTNDGRTMVWYMDENDFAVVADVEKHQNKGWGMKFREYEIYGYPNKARAVADAKMKLMKAK